MTTHARFDRRSLVSGVAAAATAITLPRLAAAQSADRGQQAMRAAEQLSVLEATPYIPALYEFYGQLHPDAQAIIPRHVVIGWYQDHWQPLGPHPAVATGVRFVDWTWPVNGVTYPDVAEVAFTQTFDHADPITDVVRLVAVGDRWCWFFGRDRAWVDAQIAHYNAEAYIPQQGSVPFGLETVVGSPPHIVTSLPATFGRGQARVDAVDHLTPDYAASPPPLTTYHDREFIVGYAMASQLRPGLNVTDTIEAHVQERIEAPPVELRSWNLAPDNGIPFAHYTRISVDVVADRHIILWGRAAASTLWEIAYDDEALLEALARALVDLATA